MQQYSLPKKGDDPSFAQFLVEQGIDSISFNPDALLKGIENILHAEEQQSILKQKPVMKNAMQAIKPIVV